MKRRGLFAACLALLLSPLAPKASAVTVRSGHRFLEYPIWPSEIKPLKRIYVNHHLVYNSDYDELFKFFRSVKGRGHQFQCKGYR
jgi:hypothetical protein